LDPAFGFQLFTDGWKSRDFFTVVSWKKKKKERIQVLYIVVSSKQFIAFLTA
jgi:hypothetical protein